MAERLMQCYSYSLGTHHITEKANHIEFSRIVNSMLLTSALKAREGAANLVSENGGLYGKRYPSCKNKMDKCNG